MDVDPSQPGLPEEIFPERGGNKYMPKLRKILLMGEGREAVLKSKCEKQAAKAVENDFRVKMLISALKTHGCDFDVKRHIACEVCTEKVCGSYDPKYNQVVICHNHVLTQNQIDVVISKELVHMFDMCRAHVDFNNLRHVACTEIRAATLMHCHSNIEAWMDGDGKFFQMKAGHENCVKSKAAKSLQWLKGMPIDYARKIVDDVFPKCYNDLEPFGCRFQKQDAEVIYGQRRNYGYY